MRGQKRKRNEQEWIRAMNTLKQNWSDVSETKGKEGNIKKGKEVNCPWMRYRMSVQVPSKHNKYTNKWSICNILGIIKCWQMRFYCKACHWSQTKEDCHRSQEQQTAYHHYFEFSISEVNVCKQFFQHSLALSNKAIDTTLKKREQEWVRLRMTNVGVARGTEKLITPGKTSGNTQNNFQQ